MEQEVYWAIINTRMDEVIGVYWGPAHEQVNQAIANYGCKNIRVLVIRVGASDLLGWHKISSRIKYDEVSTGYVPPRESREVAILRSKGYCL